MTNPSHNRGRTFPPEPLTTEELHVLLKHVPNGSSSGIRLGALIAVLFGAGLRVSEALALYPRDVDTNECYLRVRRGKGAKWRTVGIDPQSCALLDRWLDRRATLGLTARQPIFATYSKNNHGNPISDVYVRGALHRLADRAGVTKRVHPHGMRHSLAFDMARRNTPMHAIQAQLGHASLAVTDRYIRHLHPGEVIDVMKARKW